MSESSVSVTFDGKNLEDLIGFISEEYECIYSGVSGKLYAGSEAVAFIGKFFLFDKKVLLKWVDVKVVQTDQGVALQTRDKNPVLHEFSGIHHPDRCWSFLVSLHNQALLDKTAAGGEDDTVHSSTNANAVMNRRKQLRRMTSDPNKMSAHIRDFFASTEEDEQGEEGKTIKSTAAIATRKSMKRSTALIEDGLQGLLNAADNMEEEERVAIETFVGKIQGLFPCMYSQQRGTLYSGSTALYFVGNRLFFCTKLMIQSKHIQQVKMLKGKNKSEQGILVSTRDGLSHDFLEMENPDQVWASLVAIRRHVGFEENKTSRRVPSLRRQNSDPNTGAGRYDLSSPSQHDETQDQKGDIAGDVAECIKQEVQPTAHAMTGEELKVAWEELQNDKRRYATVVVKVSLAIKNNPMQSSSVRL